jgi:hypothetical protein
MASQQDNTLFIFSEIEIAFITFSKEVKTLHRSIEPERSVICRNKRFVPTEKKNVKAFPSIGLCEEGSPRHLLKLKINNEDKSQTVWHRILYDTAQKSMYATGHHTKQRPSIFKGSRKECQASKTLIG